MSQVCQKVGHPRYTLQTPFPLMQGERDREEFWKLILGGVNDDKPGRGNVHFIQQFKGVWPCTTTTKEYNNQSALWLWSELYRQAPISFSCLNHSTHWVFETRNSLWKLSHLTEKWIGGDARVLRASVLCEWPVMMKLESVHRILTRCDQAVVQRRCTDLSNPTKGTNQAKSNSYHSASPSTKTTARGENNSAGLRECKLSPNQLVFNRSCLDYWPI